MARPNGQAEVMAEHGWLTVAAAADLVRVSPSTIYGWLDEEKVESKYVGHSRYVSKDSLREYYGPEMFDILSGAV